MWFSYQRVAGPSDVPRMETSHSSRLRKSSIGAISSGDRISHRGQMPSTFTGTTGIQNHVAFTRGGFIRKWLTPAIPTGRLDHNTLYLVTTA